ncbi:MAG: peptide deformylase [Candidatus Hydrogenedentota bacterium]
MAILDLVYFPDDPLTKVARPVERFDAKLAELAESLLETMHAYEGVGLAAPQVGRSIRMFVLREPEGAEMCLVNPELSGLEGREEGEEGCLSMPKIYAQVPRATKVNVTARDLDGGPLEFEAANFLARIIQHETDHLNGILFPERLDVFTRQAVLDEWGRMRPELLDPKAQEHAAQ